MQLGGEPEFNPDLLSKNSHAQYVAGKTLKEMVYEDLVAERIAVDSYREIIQYIGDEDPTTRRIFEDILAQEEEHADDMADILKDLLQSSHRKTHVGGLARRRRWVSLRV